LLANAALNPLLSVCLSVCCAGAIELLGKGRLSADFWDWHYGVGFKWGMSSEEDGEDEGGAATATTAGEESGERSASGWGRTLFLLWWLVVTREIQE